MYKIIHNNQIIDVIKKPCFVKHVAGINKNIAVDKNQANGIVSSDGGTIYHIIGTENNFEDTRLSVYVVPIEEEEYLKLTTQVKENQNLENRVKELELLVQSLQNLVLKS